ncbi:uncharacterized membrane protein HdeD (DUF308 family) [Scopulibacillus daqui]|uniref:Uncharacterized membrane protein HdeD (DUF308 family) n=1 Tax=Scopulibacillus daqui TaxID=1469162 RepID=A0ABS2PZG5_9BACL|nr:DUF4383 domain-containing protein [Scopulibacillus daqui]MBM7645432.1 uncharacterized membrane protein HdeD (DUF308 family) [Scopulibacillus daqui]
MATHTVRLIGFIFLVIGIVGYFVPFEGLFSLTLNHNMVHLLSGLIMLLSTSSEARSSLSAKVFGGLYLLMFLAGLFTQNMMGMRLLPADTIMHFIIACVLLFAGFKSAGLTRNKTKDTSM